MYEIADLKDNWGNGDAIFYHKTCEEKLIWEILWFTGNYTIINSTRIYIKIYVWKLFYKILIHIKLTTQGLLMP